MPKRIPSILKAPRRQATSGRIRVASGVYAYSPSDAFRQKRPPTAVELVQSNRNAAYAMARLNAISVATQPLRLYATTNTSKGHAAPRCRTKALSRTQEKALFANPSCAKRLGTADRVDEVTEHPVLDVMHDVNPWFDHFQLMYLTQLYQEIVGTSFWYLVDGPGSRPSEIWPLPSWMVAIQPDYTGTDVIRNFIFTGGGGQAVLEPEQVLYFREMSLHDPYVGSWSPLRANYDYAQVHDKQTAYRDALLGNRGRPDAMLIPNEEGGELTIDFAAQNRIKAEYEQSYSLGGAGRLFVAPGGMKLEPLSWSPTDMGEIEMSRATLHDLARGYGIASPLIDGDATNRANFDAALLFHARYAVRPRCRQMEESLNSNFLPRWDDSGRLFFAFDDPVPADKVALREELIGYVSGGIISRNEARAELGHAPVDGGDELLVTNSLVPLSTAADPPDPVVANDPGVIPDETETPDEAEDDDDAFEEGDDVESGAAGKSWGGEHRHPFRRQGQGDGRHDPAGGRPGRARGQHLWAAGWAADQA